MHSKVHPNWAKAAVAACAALALAAKCGEAQLAISGSSGEFGIRRVGSTTTKTFIITNSGDGDALLRLVTLTDPDPFGAFSLEGSTCLTDGTIPKNGGTCTLAVTFRPEAEATSRTAVRVNYYWEQAPFYYDLHLNLSGTGIVSDKVPTTLSDGPAYAFGPVTLGQSATKTFTFTNDWYEDVLLGVVTDAGLGLDAPFSLRGGSCAKSGALPAPSSCTLDIAFSPAVSGVASDTLNLQYRWALSGLQEVVSLPLTGRGVR